MKQKKWPPHQEAPVLADHPINEPLPDWQPFGEAQFYCFSSGYIYSGKEWNQALKNEILEISRTGRLATNSGSPEGMPPTWEFDDRHDFELIVRGMEVVSFIYPGMVFVGNGEGWGITLPGKSNSYPNDDSYWKDVPSHGQVATKWHRSMLDCLFWSWRSSFQNTLARGSAVLMARKDSVLAPFERVAWDQWQYFRIEDQDKEAGQDWYDPKDTRIPIYAVGPTGERLYSIHIAPGYPRSNENTVEEKCIRRIKQFIEDYPDRCPMPVDDLVKKMRGEYRHLLRKQVQYCVFRAVRDCNKPEWLRAGRPEKMASIIPLK